MIITAATAVELIPVMASILGKAYKALKTGKPQSIAEELSRLNSARMRPSDEVIKDADQKNPSLAEAVKKAGR